MSLAVRAVSFTDDRQEMLELLTRNFGAGQEKPFEWRHINNPAGQAWSWFVHDGNKTAVATASVFPRRIFVAGKLVLCGQVGGFAVDAGYRSLGPALLLQRTTFEPVNSGALAFCYDCPPHDRGMSTFARLGMSPSCEMIRWALPLRSDEFLQKRLGNGIWTKPLVAAANIFLATRRANRLVRGIEITELSGFFGDEFSQLDRLVSCCGVIRTSRSAELLNWRYRENPAWDTQVLQARRAGELLGFLTWRQYSGRAYILDLFGVQLNATGPALLEAAIEVCRGRNAYSLHGFCPEHSDLEPSFRAVGFRRRDRDARVCVTYEKSGGRRRPSVEPRAALGFQSS